MNVCACGCGAEVARTFKQGHDQRLRGALLREYRTGKAGQKRSALAKARRHDWDLTKSKGSK